MLLRSPTQETRVLVSAAGTTCDRARASELSQGAVGQQSASPLADARHGRHTNNITSTVKPNTALMEQQRQALSHLLLLQLPAEGREKAGLRCSWILPLDAKTTERQFLLVACCLVEQSWTVEVSGTIDQILQHANTLGSLLWRWNRQSRPRPPTSDSCSGHGRRHRDQFTDHPFVTQRCPVMILDGELPCHSSASSDTNL